MTETAATGSRRVRRHTPAAEQPPRTASSDPDECAPTVRTPRLSAEQAQELAALLKAVADPARLQLISLIGSSDAGEMSVGELVERVGLSQPTVSHHLRVLAEAGVFTRERRASHVWYRIEPTVLERIRTFL